jgi:DNA-directed RNA polymerase subunit RPC12/RpoP
VDLRCGNCGAALIVDASVRTVRCPYCASPAIVERPPAPDRPVPTFTLPFTQGSDRAQAEVRGWLGSRGFFRDPKLRTATIDEMRGVYVPAYLYAAVARADYQAEIGENYTETQTYTTVVNGKSVTRTRTVTKTEWRTLRGRYAGYVMDVLVTASRGLHNLELEHLEPFDLKQMRRYDPAFFAGWIAEEPTLTVAECYDLARREALAKIGRALAAFMPGDTHRDLRHTTHLQYETASLLHVPVWILAARHDPTKPPVRIVMNGQTGEVYGQAPLSWPRILAVVALVVLLAGGAIFAAWLHSEGYF